MIGELVIVALALLAIGDCGANADNIQGVDGFRPEEVVKIKKLLPEFVKIGKIIDRKVPHNFNPEKSMSVAVESLEKLESTCIRGCLTKRSLREALQLFVSLEGSLGDCDHESFENLAKISLILQDAYKVLGLVRVEQVAHHYLEAHADRCRSAYLRRYKERAQSADKQVLAKVEQAFGELSVAYFVAKKDRRMFMSYGYDLVGMSEPRFTPEASRRALQEIVQQIMVQLKDTPKEPLTRAENAGKISRTDLAAILEEYLIGPCKEYRIQFGDLLTEARLYAAVENGAQAHYIRGDKQFHRALINNRLCKSLIDEQDHLYEPLSEVWNRVLLSPDDTGY